MKYLWAPVLFAVIGVSTLPIKTWLDKKFSKPVSISIYFIVFFIVVFLAHWGLHSLGIAHA